MSHDHWEDLIVAHLSGEHITQERAEASLEAAATGAYEGYRMAGHSEQEAERLAEKFLESIMSAFDKAGIIFEEE